MRAGLLREIIGQRGRIFSALWAANQAVLQVSCVPALGPGQFATLGPLRPLAADFDLPDPIHAYFSQGARGGHALHHAHRAH